MNWRQHAASCDDCSELLTVGDWMISLAANTGIAILPTAGFLMVKARIREKQAAAQKAIRPVKWMAAFSGTILVLGLVLLLRSQSHVTISLANAVGMLWSFAGVVGIGSIFAAIICAAAAYLMKETPQRPVREERS